MNIKYKDLNSFYVQKIMTTPSESTIKRPMFKYKIDMVYDVDTILIKWRKFDLNQEKYIDDIENTIPFLLEIDGEVYEIEVEDGKAEIVLEFEETGEHFVSTVNELVENGEVIVNV